MSSFDHFVDEMIAHIREVDRATGRFLRGVADQTGPATTVELAAAADGLTALADRMPDVPGGLTRRRRESAAEVREWYGAAVSRLAAAAREARAEWESSGRVSPGTGESKVDGANVILREVNLQLAEIVEGDR